MHDSAQDRNSPADFGFLLIPQFSMLSLAGVLEPLRMANRLADKELYRWWLLTPTDEAVEASNRILFAPTARLAEAEGLDTLVVVAGIDVERQCSPALMQCLRQLAARGLNIGAISVGSLLLAKAGLLEGYRCTVHWENLAGLREQFPGLNLTSELYEIDGRRLTCSGGSAGLDMMMHLIGNRHGHALATAVAEQCIHPEIRKSQASQRLSLRNRLDISHPRLIEVIECMERHLEDTLDCAQLAAQVGISVRQMDRLFRSSFGTTPARFYLGMRLDRARALLQQTSMPVLQVGLACGFVSDSHFIRCYRERFGHTPAGERRRERQRTPANLSAQDPLHTG